MYLTVREYEGTAPGVIAEVKQREQSLRQTLSKIDGFVDWYAVDLGSGLATISITRDKAGAEESVRVAANWVRENIAQWAPNPPRVTNGEVALRIGG